MAYEICKIWTTRAGLEACIIKTLGYMSHYCGYVAVRDNNLAYGKGYHDPVDFITQEQVNSAPVGKIGILTALTAGVGGEGDGDARRSLDLIIQVHGGLTYSSREENSDYPINKPGAWWFGYDCAHAGDEDNPEIDLEYNINECELMAEQLAKFKKPVLLLENSNGS